MRPDWIQVYIDELKVKLKGTMLLGEPVAEDDHDLLLLAAYNLGKDDGYETARRAYDEPLRASHIRRGL